ncbi:MAG TPA: ATP-binding cassette domain-containing protein [Candidatus Saccharimonadales bacterium]|nr:ATP-binding cassette domain-containing protein [Candidatus Saccharimonadales bacterium]
MIADITITEKSFGPKSLMTGVRFSIDDGEKIGVIGRNGVGKSTLFGILAGTDHDFTGDIVYRRGTVVVATQQEHHDIGDTTVLQYVLQGLPEYASLSDIIETYPETMGSDMKKIEEYTAALQRFDDKGFYQIEEQIERELDAFQLEGIAHRQFSTLSGGQKRLVEVVKVMHSQAQLALVDEPTNHMDYVAKAQFVEWLKSAKEAVLVITHDRDVLNEVDRIVELKDGGSVSYKGNYDAYLKQNAVSTGSQMNEFEMIEKRIANLKVKVLDYQRLKEKSRNPGTIQKFKRLEETSRKELAELQAKEKPTFWIDKASAENLNYKVASQYDKFKAKNIRMNLRNDESRSKHILVNAKNVSLGYGDTPLFSGVNIDLREGEAMELRGRNGAGKTTLIKVLLAKRNNHENFTDAKYLQPTSEKAPGPLSDLARSHFAEVDSYGVTKAIRLFDGEVTLDTRVRIGIYEQEVDQKYFPLPLEDAIERMYLDRGLSISTTKVRGLMNDYLFTEGDGKVPLSRLSGGQKARFQLISMLANDPQLLILDEPTNHLDLPSIEELETALAKYSGAILYVSHDGYFQQAIGGEVIKIGA